MVIQNWGGILREKRVAFVVTLSENWSSCEVMIENSKKRGYRVESIATLFITYDIGKQ